MSPHNIYFLIFSICFSYESYTIALPLPAPVSIILVKIIYIIKWGFQTLHQE